MIHPAIPPGQATHCEGCSLSAHCLPGVLARDQVTDVDAIVRFLGVALETVSRLLGRLQRQGLISVAGRTLVLHDIPALEALVPSTRPRR